MHALNRARPAGCTFWAGPHLAALGALWLTHCDAAYPEVALVNRTAAEIQLRRLSFNGCAWNTVLSFGETTAVARCLPGADRIHFEKLDVAAYCASVAAPGTHPAPTWFNYQTVAVHGVDYGEFYVFEITLDDLEQDFSVPGPYGH